MHDGHALPRTRHLSLPSSLTSGRVRAFFGGEAMARSECGDAGLAMVLRRPKPRRLSLSLSVREGMRGGDEGFALVRFVFGLAVGFSARTAAQQ